jgi:hypothetical protein
MKKTIEYVQGVAPAVYAEVKSFFGAPVFFIILGCSFLLATANYLDHTHPSLIFLLAVLGVSIVLYGTGTQGVGSAEFKSVPIKVAVAGGAGVLAAIFGFGILWKGENMPKVFKSELKYGLVRLKETSNLPLELRTLRISAKSWDGEDRHLLSREEDRTLEILVPLTFSPSRQPVCLIAMTETEQVLTEKRTCPVVEWGRPTDQLKELVSYVGTGEFRLVLPKNPDFVGQ